MDSETVTKIAVCVSVLAVMLSAATLYVMLDEEDGPGDSRYTFYIGMDAGSTDAQMSAVEQGVKDLIAITHGSGYTYLGIADGGTAADGTVTEQRTLVFVVALIDDSRADAIADAAGAMDGVEAVMVEKAPVDVSFR